MSTDDDAPDVVAGIDLSNTRLKRCEDCGAVTPNRGGHVCNSTQRAWLTSKPNRRISAILCEFDDGDPAETVVRTDGPHSRAYHPTQGRAAVDDAPAPRHARCRQAALGRESTWLTITRGQAQDAGRFPCTQCFGIDLDAVEARLEAEGELR